MRRSPCCSKQGLNRGAWTKTEDMILSDYIRIHGDGEWRNLPQKAGLRRCGKSCRLRWMNYLRPDIKRGNISPYEDDLIVRLHRLLGNRWSLIAGRLPGRTDNEIKNYWNTRLSKKLLPTNDSEPNSSTQNLKTSSKFLSSVHDHVLKTTPVKTKAVRYCEMVRPNRSKGYGRSNCNSDEIFRLCSGKETTNSSKPWADLLLNDPVTQDYSEGTPFAMADVNFLETEAENSICSMWNLQPERSPQSHYFGRDAATLAESLSDLNDLQSPNCNLLSSPSDCFPYSGLEEFNREAATLAAETNEFEYLRYDQSNVRSINSFTVSDDQIMDEIYHN